MRKRLYPIILCLLFLAAVPLYGQVKGGNFSHRIVSLAPALTELVCFLGYGKNLVGRSEVCSYPAFVRQLPAVGAFGKPEGERILALRPTLILANDLVHPAMIRSFRNGGTRVLLKQCRSLEDYCEWVDLLGKELSCREKAQKEQQRIRLLREKWEKRNRELPRRKKVLWVIWDSPLMVAGKGSLPHTVLTFAGGKNIAEDLKQEYAKISYEWLLNNPPEVIVWTASPKRVQHLKKHPFWKQLEAVRKGRVIHSIDQDLLQRPGPRLPEGVDSLHKALKKI